MIFNSNLYKDKYIERLLDGIEELETGCIEWKRAKNSEGYGYLWNGKFNERVHRMSYKLFNGSIPDGKIILHSCDNPSCCNPKHLKIGTRAENNKDRAIKNRNRNQQGEKNNMSKLSSEEVLQIRNSKKSENVLGSKYGVSRALIGNIRRGEIWKHL